MAVRLPLLVSQCPHRRCRDPQADRRTGAGSRADDAAAHTRPCKERRDRVTAERRINEQRIAEERRQYEAWLAATYQPPPF